MKYIHVKEELCTKCHLCEETCSMSFFKVKDKEKSCIRINDEKESNGNEIINVCNQCGECIDICPEQAIYRANNGLVLIDKKKCVGCYICVGFCPSLSMGTSLDLVEPFKCISCGLCVKKCESGAISMGNTDNDEQAKL